MFLGPYTVLRVIDPYNFVIRKATKTKPIVVHRDKLKLYYQPKSVDVVDTANGTADTTTHIPVTVQLPVQHHPSDITSQPLTVRPQRTTKRKVRFLD